MIVKRQNLKWKKTQDKYESVYVRKRVMSGRTEYKLQHSNGKYMPVFTEKPIWNIQKCQIKLVYKTHLNTNCNWKIVKWLECLARWAHINFIHLHMFVWHDHSLQCVLRITPFKAQEIILALLPYIAHDNITKFVMCDKKTSNFIFWLCNWLY